jgi:hypothetical protein
MNHRSANRRATERSPRQAGRSEGISRSNIKSEPQKESNPRFAEDFNLEHSLSVTSITVIRISSSTIATEPSMRRPPYAQDLGSPNCVYLG